MPPRLCMLTVTLALALWPLPLLGASCPAPPQGFGPAWWSSYKSWCRSCGGTISDLFNDAQANGGCRLSSPDSSSSPSSAASTGAAIGQALGQAIVDGFRQAQEQARIRAAEARIEAARLQALQEQQEAERQRLFQAHKSSLLSAAGVEGGLRLRDTATVDLSAIAPNATVASLKDGRPAATTPVSWGPPELIHLTLSSQASPALPAATRFITGALDYLKAKAGEQLRDSLGEAAAASLGLTGVVLVNATELPELILPALDAASRGELSVGEADRLLPRAVNTLYNTGALSNEALEAALAQPDAAQGLLQWGSDKARAATTAAAAEQIGTLTGEEAAGSAILMAADAVKAAGLWTGRGDAAGAR